MKLKGGGVVAVVNGKSEFICENCYDLRFARYSSKKCEVCGKIDIQNLPYFFKKGKQVSLVCRECNDRVYGDCKKWIIVNSCLVLYIN